MQCIKCGHIVKEGAEKCSNCGKHQPDATPSKKPIKKTFFVSLATIFLVIGLCTLPLIAILILTLISVGVITDASIATVAFQIIKLSLITAGPPLLVSLIFYILGK